MRDIEKGLAHRRSSTDFVRTEGKAGRGEGGRKEGAESSSQRFADPH